MEGSCARACVEARSTPTAAAHRAQRGNEFVTQAGAFGKADQPLEALARVEDQQNRRRGDQAPDPAFDRRRIRRILDGYERATQNVGAASLEQFREHIELTRLRYGDQPTAEGIAGSGLSHRRAPLGYSASNRAWFAWCASVQRPASV
jgi:hypothetical protein